MVPIYLSLQFNFFNEVVGLAIAMGRTLVLPPSKKMYLLEEGGNGGEQRKHFGFEDFFPMKQMAEENAAIDMITTKEFLEREAMSGNLINKATGQISFPPGNRTDWEGFDPKHYTELKLWLRTVSLVPQWRTGDCLATFPAYGDHSNVNNLNGMLQQIRKDGVSSEAFNGKPVPVDSKPIDRMKENISNRHSLCIYNQTMQDEFLVHFVSADKLRLRLLTHFYAFLFMEDWKEDLWLKRFMRDHMRYNDEIQCAAARIVKAIRSISRKRNPAGNGEFDTFHIRRGDFQFKQTRVSAEEILQNSRDVLTPNTTIFIATDERKKEFFNPLRDHYYLLFLDDFKNELKGVNTNFYGMIDQLVASRGKTFVGWYVVVHWTLCVSRQL